MNRLNAATRLPLNIIAPPYNRRNHGTGIVHLGPGAFARSHLAFYTDGALATQGGNWRIVGIGLRSNRVAEEINPQDGLYTLLEKDASGTKACVIGSISHILTAPEVLGPVLQVLVAPETRIVSLTITEKGYGLQRFSGGVDVSNSLISADLTIPESPRSAIGLIVRGLQLRRQCNIPPFTVLCCDNLPKNGKMLHRACIDFSHHIDTRLSDWIASQVAFPSTMVDRITPAQTVEVLQEAQSLIGCSDYAAIATEPFHQWIIEDSFPLGCPAWDAAGALFTKDVQPYEDMKLRMLNGAHSMLAYCGFPAGFNFVRETMNNMPLKTLTLRHLRATKGTFPQPPGVDLEQYTEQLIARFSNPAIHHPTYQIAMDGTEKLPQRFFAPALSVLEQGRDVRPFAFATAAWMYYCMGKKHDGETYNLRDPKETAIKDCLQNARTLEDVCCAFHNLDNVFPIQLAKSYVWKSSVLSCLTNFCKNGSMSAIEDELSFMRSIECDDCILKPISHR